MNKKIHKVEYVKFDNRKMYLLIDGKEYSFVIKEISERLYKASPKERETCTIMASGYGIHWPLIDEDLSIDGLLGVKHLPETQINKSIKTTPIH